MQQLLEGEFQNAKIPFFFGFIELLPSELL